MTIGGGCARVPGVKAISEQMEALAVDLRDRGISYDRIAGEVGLTPVEARRIVARARRKRGCEFSCRLNKLLVQKRINRICARSGVLPDP
jgi:hypothetical protein